MNGYTSFPATYPFPDATPLDQLGHFATDTDTTRGAFATLYTTEQQYPTDYFHAPFDARLNWKGSYLDWYVLTASRLL